MFITGHSEMYLNILSWELLFELYLNRINYVPKSKMVDAVSRTDVRLIRRSCLRPSWMLPVIKNNIL